MISGTHTLQFCIACRHPNIIRWSAGASGVQVNHIPGPEEYLACGGLLFCPFRLVHCCE